MLSAHLPAPMKPGILIDHLFRTVLGQSVLILGDKVQQPFAVPRRKNIIHIFLNNYCQSFKNML